MYQIELRPEAENEFIDSLGWYGKRSQLAATNFKLAFDAAISILKKRPKSYPAHYKNYYQIHLKKYPFTLIYIIEESTVIITAVFHQRRNPSDKYP